MRTARTLAATALATTLATGALAGSEALFPTTQYGDVTLRMPQSTLHLESVLGGNSAFEKLATYDPSDRIRKLAEPVGRLDVNLSAGGVSTCTASILANGYLITNHHCVPGDGTYGKVLEASLLMGYYDDMDPSGTVRYQVDTTPVETRADLDYSILRVIGTNPEPRWGHVTLESRDPRPGEALLIVHHPGGMPKHVTRGGCRSLAPIPVFGTDLRHRCDTIGGSSGSPVFSDNTGAVVGLHYAGSLTRGVDQFNSAKRMSAILDASAVLRSMSGGSVPAVVAAVATPTPTPRTGSVPSQIAAVPGGGSSSWDHAIYDILTAAFDANGNGLIDSRGELSAIDCDVWKALDTGTRKSKAAGLHHAYGFATDGVWRGANLSFAAAVRAPGSAALQACGLVSTSAPSGPTTPTDTRAALATLPDSEGWEASAAAVLLATYDTDRSGSLDRPSEIDAIDCATWRTLDAHVRTKWSSGLSVIYGFEAGFIWVGSAFGVDESQRDRATAGLSTCKLTRDTAPASSTPAVKPTGGAVTIDDSEVIEGILMLPDDASWPEQARPLVLKTYDRNGSGTIDTASELTAISCRVWRGLDQSTRRTWDVRMSFGFGFEAGEDVSWYGHRLGIDESQRAAALTAISSCGLVH